VLVSTNLLIDYRFGFNGQEKDNEVAGIGNSNTAQFWQYDTRLGRRWNIDPVDQIRISNYAVMKLNPILYNDPQGKTAKKTVKGNTITYSSKLYLYGDLTNKEMAKAKSAVIKQFKNKLTNKSYMGEEDAGYGRKRKKTVKFDIKVEVVSKDKAKQLAAKNGNNLENNFVKIEKSTRSSRFSVGNNFGIFTTADLYGPNSNSTGIVHEYFHGLGLHHPKNDVVYIPGPGLVRYQGNSNYLTKPRIILPRGTIIAKKRSWPLGRPKLTNQYFEYMDPDKRQVTSEDINEVLDKHKKGGGQRANNVVYD